MCVIRTGYSIESTIVFFFNDTATAEIYTYRHTLALHGALPISSASLGSNSQSTGPPDLNQTSGASGACGVNLPRTEGRASKLTSPPPPQARSEEHTSELQSLMRNSYAVFCLKKKKIEKTPKLKKQQLESTRSVTIVYKTN